MKKSKNWGSDANNIIGKIVHTYSRTLCLLEEIKLHNTSSFFINKFKKIASKWSFTFKITFISCALGRYLNFFSFIGIFLCVFFKKIE